MKDIKTINCHCGQPGDQKMNMLYCVKCKRWLHEECVKCLDVPMLLGDRFFILICSACNAGSECLARIELTWSDVMHLVIYNLSVIHKKTYFDLDGAILPFVHDNWERLCLFGPITSVKNEDRRNKVLEALLKDGKRFKSGREIKKSKNIFGLRQRTPPDIPAVQPNAAKVQNDVVVWEFQVKERPYRILTSAKPKGSKENTKNVKLKKKLSTQSRSKQIEVSKCRGSLPCNENGVLQKAKNRVKKSTVTTFTEESARSGLLDSLIPAPPDFSQENNPFLPPKERNAVKRPNSQACKTIQPQPTKRKYKEEHITHNGNHKLLYVEQAKSGLASSSLQQNSDSEMFFDAKDYFSNDMQTTKEDGLCIIGKRVTSKGKIQYLFQRNRTKVESSPSEQEHPFTITFCCHCSKCRVLNKLLF